MTKFILDNKVVYDSGNHCLFFIDQPDSQTTLAIPASLCLLAILQKKNEMTSLEELLAFAWESRGMTVSSNTIYQNISLLRKSLSKFGLADDFIKTVPKRGFVVLGTKFSVMAGDTEKDSLVGEEEAPVIINKQTESNGGEKGPRRDAILFFMLTAIIVCGGLFFCSYKITTSNEITNSPYIYPEFTKLHYAGKCHVFRNTSLLADADFINFISAHDIECNRQNWLYIINYPPAPQMFVLNCSSDVLSADNRHDLLCKSQYYY